MTKKISFFALILLIISAVDSNRNLPSAAIFGAPLIFFFLFSAVFFLFPSALIAAELSAAFPEEGGIYHWVKAAFNDRFGMIAVWLQWVNSVIWFPTILTFLAGVLTYLFDPALMDHKIYMISVITILFWSLTIINLFGISISAKFNSFFSVIGTIFPMLFLIALGIYWILRKEPFQIPITAEAIFPSLAKFDNWTALVAIMGSFVGMELSGVHVANTPHPQKTFPRALFLAAIYILATMLFGSLTIAIVLPMEEINLAGGLMQVFYNFFKVFHLEGLIPIMTLLIVLGSIGGMINWLIAPAKSLHYCSQYGFLPPFFSKLNRHGAPSRILIAQAIIVSFISIVIFLLPSINAFYWFLTALSNCLYMFMYILMFISAYRLRSHRLPGVFRVPGGYPGLCLFILLGLIGATLTIIIGFVPPSQINIGNHLHYVLLIAFGNIIAILPVFAFITYKKKTR